MLYLIVGFFLVESNNCSIGLYSFYIINYDLYKVDLVKNELFRNEPGLVDM